MKWAPIVDLAWKKTAEARKLRTASDALLAINDDLRAELSVQRCRTTRWRRAAIELAEGNPEAMRRLGFQAQSDELADLDELDTNRNTTPRCLP